MPQGKLSPRRDSGSPPIPHRMLNPPPPPKLIVRTRLNPNVRMFATNIAVVTGAFPPISSESPLLSATRENRRLVPHSWQRVALIPTSAPQAGQIFGRGCCCSPPPKNPRIAVFHFSTRHCHR